MKTTKIKNFLVTITNVERGSETRSVTVAAQNENSAIKKAMALGLKHGEFTDTKNAIIKRVELMGITGPKTAAETDKVAKFSEQHKVGKVTTLDLNAATTANKKITKHAEEMLGLTEKQAKAMNYLIKQMASHKDSEPTFSDVGVKEICDLFESPFVGGAVISTLIEKGLIVKHEAPTDNRDILGKWVICFTEKSQSMR